MSSQNEHETLLNGEIVIYQRGTKRKVYNARFNNVQDESKRYVRVSLKTSDRTLAIERAIALYREHHSRAFLGLKTDGTTIEQLMELTLRSSTQFTRDTAKSFYKTYWSEFMEDEDLSRWKTEDIDRYFEWRIDKAINNKDSRGWKPSEDSVSATTLNIERNILRKLFETGYKHHLIARVPGFPARMDTLNRVHKLPRNSRRGRFTDEQYKIVSRDFASTRSMMNNKDFQPVKAKEGNVFHSWSRANGDGSSKTLDKDRQWLVKQAPRFSRAQYWFVCVLMANTGIRPVEVVKLKHKDIKVIKDPDDGTLYTVIKISEEVSKVNKYRDVIAQDRHLTFDRYMEYRREILFRFGQEPKPNDWLFPQQSDYQNHLKYLWNTVRPNLKRIGLHIHSKEANHGVQTFFSAYSFRAYYITKRLENGLNIYTLAKNCGVSIQTLSSTYDYNENWAFRKQMTEHIGKHSIPDKPKHNIEGFTEDW